MTATVLNREISFALEEQESEGEKIFGGGNSHEWFAIYGPKLYEMPHQRNGQVILDPWLTGGYRVKSGPNEHHYLGTYLFWPYLFNVQN